MADPESLAAHIPPEMAGMRLDQALARIFPEFSRSRLQEWLKAGKVSVDRHRWRPRDKVSGGERVVLQPLVLEKERWEPQSLPLRVVYQDPDILVIDKPAGLVVHPASGHADGTLVNALLYHFRELSRLPRAGIVHRIDKDTSGLLVVARSLRAHKSLVTQLSDHIITREYLAIALGIITAGGRIDAPIGRHPTHRTRMAVVDAGKPATTHYRVVRRFRIHTHIRVVLETGRTHQVRVHMAYIRHPLLGDPVYGGRLRIPPDCQPRLTETLRQFRRQALHASRLALEHPVTGQAVSWESPLPHDMAHLLEELETDQVGHAAGG